MANTPPTDIRTAAIIVAAGASRRMGLDKLAWPLEGVPVLRRSVAAFLTATSVDQVILVGPESRWELLAGLDMSKPVIRVDGGAQRQDSVACGMAAVAPGTQWVAVHDAARPLIHPDDIDRCVHMAMSCQAAAMARRTTETMFRADSAGCTTQAVDRDHLWCMETPQVFEVGLLRAAYARLCASGELATDEVTAVHALGHPVQLLESSRPNLKITSPADLALATALFQSFS